MTGGITVGEALVITSGKGGVGKSTVAVNLAASLGRLGCRTVLIDADTGLRSLDVLLGMENDLVYDLTDVAEGICKLRQAVVKARDVDGVSLLAAAQLRDMCSVPRGRMESVASELRQMFDYVIIDSPAGVDLGFRIAAAGADRAIIVANNDVICQRDAERVKGLLERAGIGDISLLLNRVPPEKLKKKEKSSCALMAERLELPLIGNIRARASVFREAAQKGRPAALESEEMARAFEEIARRVMGEDIPVQPVRMPGFWASLLKG